MNMAKGYVPMRNTGHEVLGFLYRVLFVYFLNLFCKIVYIYLCVFIISIQHYHF